MALDQLCDSWIGFDTEEKHVLLRNYEDKSSVRTILASDIYNFFPGDLFVPITQRVPSFNSFVQLIHN